MNVMFSKPQYTLVFIFSCTRSDAGQFSKGIFSAKRLKEMWAWWELEGMFRPTHIF